MPPPSWEFTPYFGTVYRNIATCDPKQFLYDDITGEQEKLDKWVQATSNIDHAQVELHRPFQYGELDDDLRRVFERGNWRTGRFGDGRSYGVWYSAEDELTSLYESAYWTYRLGLDNVLNHGEIYAVDRTLYRAKLDASRSVDLTTWREHFPALVHPMDYSFCQQIGRKAVEREIELFRSPSARRVGGVCTPVFQVLSIKEGTATGTFHFYARPDGGILIQSRDGVAFLSLQFADLQNPHFVN